MKKWFARLTASLIACCLSFPAFSKEDPKKPYAGSTAPPLAPAEAQKHFKVPEGFEVRLFAAEPDVINPVAMSFDEKGRLWVVELYEYPYERPKDQTRKGRDRVICLEDPDGTGRATKRTVVAEDLWLATAVCWGNGGIYVGQAPDFYFYPITDTPDGPKAGPRQTLLTGFGLDDKHELLNSFCWGPDGWLYMTHGVFTHSLVKNLVRPEEPVIKFDAGVGRYNAYTHKFEVWCDGISNQWGIDWDAAGNAFVSACVVEHIWHVVPGGVYVRQGGVPTIPYTYQLLPPINKDKHRHHMAAYGGINVYQGNLFPPEYRGTVFMGNIHGNCIDHDKLTPDGSSFAASDMRTAKDTGEFLEANDDWFRPVSEQVGPDGALWIMDWYDKYPCYQNSHAPDLDRERGRIWRVVYVGKEAGKDVPTHEKGMDLSEVDPISLLSHPNVWQRRVGERLLTEFWAPRGGPAPAPGPVDIRIGPPGPTRELTQLALHGETLEIRIAGLWSLISCGKIPDEVDKLAADPEPAIRAWTARFLGNAGERISPAACALLKKLATDSDARVLAGVAVAVRGLSARDGLELIPILVQQPAVAKDPHLPFLIWMATEPKLARPAWPRAAADGGRAQLAADAQTAPGGNATYLLQWMARTAGVSSAAADLSRRIIHRLVDANDQEELRAAIAFVNTLSPQQSAVALGAVQGLLDVQPKKGAVRPEGTAALDLDKLQSSANGELKFAASRLAAIWGNAAAAEAGLKAINDPQAPLPERLKSVRLASQLNSDAARSAVTKLIGSDAPESLRLEAIRTLGEIGSDDSADAILASWNHLSPEARRSAAEVLTSRLPWSKALLKAVQSKTVTSEDISQTAFRTLARQRDKDLAAMVASTIGRYRESDPDKQKLIAAKKLVMLNGPVDYDAGHALAQKTCLVCHTFYGEGMHVGPDLTGVGRSTIDALLNNVIDPNQIIGAGYENTIVETKDKRTLAGRLVENAPDHVKLLSSGDKEDIIARADIASMRTEKISVMPEGLVDTMPDADLRNLLWYIYSPAQDNRDKRLRIDLADKKLIVKAKLPGSADMVELLSHVTDPAKRPYLHPLRDPSASLVLTHDQPADHPWQHGVFTGLHEVNGLDFWSEKSDQQHFVKLLDLAESNDRVGWRAQCDWISHDGAKVLEEEQAVTVYNVDSPDLYRIDFDWTLRAPKDKPVKIGSFDYGGFSIRLNTATGHTHLNSSGERNAETSNHAASWCDVTVPFGDRAAGVTVLDHPSNLGFPSKWRVDGQGMINPSPSLKGDWSIPAGGSRAFHYRLIVHAGPANSEKLKAEFNQFGAMTFEGDSQPRSGDRP
jgi:putative membrane-bound dehydrogenase-like protein